jgi:glutamate carboxypeptidase
MPDLLEYFKTRSPEQLEFLRFLVELESPTNNKRLVDQLGQALHERLSIMGANITVYPRETVGDVRVVKWNGTTQGKPIMLLTHLDTVWPEGTLSSDMPIRQDEYTFYGPGALDMKGGITASIMAIQGLLDRDEMPDRPIWLVLTTDEETGSRNSQELITELALQAGLVLVTEPAGDNEAIKTWRKGVARYWIRSVGKASHSGSAPEAGINAIIDSAHQAIKVHDLNDLPNGTSVSVTQVNGGVALNVIPPESQIYADVRFLKQSEFDRIDAAIRSLTPVVPGANVVVDGYLDRPPMERNKVILGTYQQARQIGESLGLSMSETGSGGGSDGNFTAALGIPTLDGMGPEGQGMHALHEQVSIRSLYRRSTLIAGILRDWTMDTEN